MGRQRTIKFYVDYRIKKPKKKLPDGLRVTVVSLPSLRTAGLKSHQKTDYAENNTILWCVITEKINNLFEHKMIFCATSTSFC